MEIICNLWIFYFLLHYFVVKALESFYVLLKKLIRNIIACKKILQEFTKNVFKES